MIRWDVDLDGAGGEMDRLAAGPGAGTIAKFETALMEGTLVTEARVHVITGRLKTSVHSSSVFTGDEWSGTIAAARHPGIYELARGNSPTKYHPEGAHYFLSPGGPKFEHDVREALWDWVTDGHGGGAPTEGLGPWSGGY